MEKSILLLCLCLSVFIACGNDDEAVNNEEIQGFNLLSKLSGHWVGTNETVFGFYDWFTFDFRPISASHLHSIYEGGTNQNIITSLFVADYEGKQQIMARNGGWLGNQYRATYFVLDSLTEDNNTQYYRLVDAVGGAKRAYMELRFEGDTLKFDAYKDNSGMLDEPIKHMSFVGANYNPEYAVATSTLFNFPQRVSEVDLNGKFVGLIDNDSALFLEEADDPFPKSAHGHLSDLRINIERSTAAEGEDLLLYLSTQPIINSDGSVDFTNLDRHVVRTIDVGANEDFYISTYLHPGDYFITLFSDKDGNFFPSSGDVANVSKAFEVSPEDNLTTGVVLDLELP